MSRFLMVLLFMVLLQSASGATTNRLLFVQTDTNGIVVAPTNFVSANGYVSVGTAMVITTNAGTGSTVTNILGHWTWVPTLIADFTFWMAADAGEGGYVLDGQDPTSVVFYVTSYGGVTAWDFFHSGVANYYLADSASAFSPPTGPTFLTVDTGAYGVFTSVFPTITWDASGTDTNGFTATGEGCPDTYTTNYVQSLTLFGTVWTPMTNAIGGTNIYYLGHP